MEFSMNRFSFNYMFFPESDDFRPGLYLVFPFTARYKIAPVFDVNFTVSIRHFTGQGILSPDNRAGQDILFPGLLSMGSDIANIETAR
jgi:hypothetical protein